jgi:hypothetical protein
MRTSGGIINDKARMTVFERADDGLQSGGGRTALAQYNRRETLWAMTMNGAIDEALSSDRLYVLERIRNLLQLL